MRSYYKYGTNLSNKEMFTSVVNTPYGVRRYFSSIDTDVYFGDTIMDEMVAFDFIYDEKKIPIYGYNNYSPKRIITGQKTIQGSFAMNLTTTGFLANLIKDLPESIYQNDYEEVGEFCADDNAALFGKGFDITLSYGDSKKEKASYGACSQTLIGCYITSYRQAFDTSGEPILDMYTFIAKDLVVQDGQVLPDLTEEEEAPKDEGTGLIIRNWQIQGEEDKSKKEKKNAPNNVLMKTYINFTHKSSKGKFIIDISPYDKDVKFTITKLKLTLDDVVYDDLGAPNNWKIPFEFDVKKKQGTIYTFDNLPVELSNALARLFKDEGLKIIPGKLTITCTCNNSEFDNFDYKIDIPLIVE